MHQAIAYVEYKGLPIRSYRVALIDLEISSNIITPQFWGIDKDNKRTVKHSLLAGHRPLLIPFYDNKKRAWT